MDNVCRFCLNQIVRRKATSIRNHQFKSMVRRVFPFEIDCDAKLPMRVCGKCFSIVREFHWYSQKVQAVQELLERQFSKTENASSCSVEQAAVDDDASALKVAEEQIGVSTDDLITPSERFSDIESAGPEDTQRTEQDATPANHTDSEHSRTGCSDSNDSQNNTIARGDGAETESMQCDEITNHSSESSTVHAEAGEQPATVTAHDKESELLAYSTTQAAEYDQSSETINDYFQGLSEIVISDTAGWFEDVQNIICEEVPLLDEFEIFNNCNFAVVDESVDQEPEPVEPSQPQDGAAVASSPCTAVTFPVAEATQEEVAQNNGDSNTKASEEMDYEYEEESGVASVVSEEDLIPSDSTAIVTEELRVDTSMNEPNVEIDPSQELQDATEPKASGMSSQDATATGASIDSHQPTYHATQEWINGHFENQHDGLEDEHSDLIDHVQEVPYEEVVYSEEAENQSTGIADRASEREVSTERELNEVPMGAKSVDPSQRNAQSPAASLSQAAAVLSSPSSGFMAAFSKFVQDQNPPVKSDYNGKRKLESQKQVAVAVASISGNQQNPSPKTTKFKIRKQMASNELDSAIEKYFDLRCELCPPSAEECFTTFDGLTAHFRKVHDIRGYARCCGKQYFYRRQLMEHIDYHRGLLRCSVCDKNFATKAALKQHENIHHRSTIVQYPCTECTTVCDSQIDLLAHQSILHNSVCTSETQENEGHRTKAQTRGAPLRSELLHRNNRRGVHCGNENDDTAKPNNTLPCLHCSKVFRSEKRLNSHMLLYHPRNPFPCELCSYLSPNMSLLRKHKRIVHAARITSDSGTIMAQHEHRIPEIVDDTNAETPKETYLCKVCGFVGSASLLALHSHQQHHAQKTVCTMSSDDVKKNDNKVTEVPSASGAFSTP
ncbi:zinc finger and BTB domain-containing protein 47-like isoform X1 [Anopheles albimanus]|uniref:C2H2-type domain-containing protein n=1 Tax=Anopheles albimanus TaxID=7167 RepID=A0A182FFB6_ANOAL|nr:zinc finger and BTB domain-containing protein 47-like isoform X1 [Anopheles albimanus]